VIAQRLTLGAVVGTSVTGDFHPGSYNSGSGTAIGGPYDGQTVYSTITTLPTSRQFIVGPKLELRLPWRLSVEADALHRDVHQKTTMIAKYSGGGTTVFDYPESTNATWEIPVLAKYRFSSSNWNPFLEAGPSYRPVGSGRNLSHAGITAGGGVEVRMWRLNLSPQIRYTHWKASYGLSEPVLDQVEVFVGIDQAGGSETWTSAFGRRFSGGVIAGIGLGDDLPSAGSPFDYISISPESNSGLYGAMLEFQFHGNVAVEADGIYRPLHFTTSGSAEGSVREAILTWEFPILARYKFRPLRRIRPFAELGPSFRLSGNLHGGAPSPYGVTAGSGVEAHVSKVKVAPALRYTRWAQGAGIPVNRWEFLVGVYL
jgi:hypothetical protein